MRPPIRAASHRPPPSGEADRRAGPSSGAPAPTSPGSDEGSQDERSTETILAAMSTEERLRTRDFAVTTPEELARLRALMEGMALAPPRRRSRRQARDARGRRIDLRATLRRAHRTAGDPVEQIRRRARALPRLVFICDIFT
jgi:uncharacterized protein with von Willebrand factor type A (vWA) domain